MSERRSCAFDNCHDFEPDRKTQRYCRPCACAQRVYNSKRRYDKRPFEQPREFKTLTIRNLPDGYRVLIVNDLQIPFWHAAALAAVQRFWADYKPNLEIYNGDIVDFYEISDFDHNPSRRFHLQDELDMARSFLDGRANANPDARRIFLDGNHEDRLRRYLWRHGSGLSSLRALTLEELLGLDELGFEHLPYRSVVDLLGFRIEHGYKASKSAAYPVNVSRYMAIASGSSGLCGHTHRCSSYYWTDARGTHGYIENGCLCRLDLEYAPFPNWQHGFTYGIVQEKRLHLHPVVFHGGGFVAEGEFYK